MRLTCPNYSISPQTFWEGYMNKRHFQTFNNNNCLMCWGSLGVLFWKPKIIPCVYWSKLNLEIIMHQSSGIILAVYILSAIHKCLWRTKSSKLWVMLVKGATETSDKVFSRKRRMHLIELWKIWFCLHVRITHVDMTKLLIQRVTVIGIGKQPNF